MYLDGHISDSKKNGNEESYEMIEKNETVSSSSKRKQREYKPKYLQFGFIQSQKYPSLPF